MILFVIFIAFSCSDARAALHLSLNDAVDKALEASSQIKSAESDVMSADHQAAAQMTYLLPRLTFDANYRYVTNVPSVTLGPLGTIQFGDYNNYSVGPTLSYTLWDTGLARDSWNSFKNLAEARKQDLENAKIQIQLSSRLAYFRVQLAIEELKLVTDSLKVSNAQYKDISDRFAAGASSRTDQLDAHREAQSMELNLEQDQANLELAYRDLSALLLADTQAAELDPLEETYKSFASANFSPPGEEHPRIRSLQHVATASHLASESQSSSLWPTLQVSARASYEYPNTILLASYEQNTVQATLTMPLFEWSRTRHLSSEKEAEAISTEYRREQLKTDLQRDWDKTKIQLETYRRQRTLNAEMVGETEEISRLIYSSYKNGRTNYLDVQSANLRALEAKVQAARTTAQFLIQSATLESLSKSNPIHSGVSTHE